MMTINYDYDDEERTEYTKISGTELPSIAR